MCIFFLTFNSKNLIKGTQPRSRKSGAKFDVKGESLNEERNQEKSACQEKGTGKEKSASQKEGPCQEKKKINSLGADRSRSTHRSAHPHMTKLDFRMKHQILGNWCWATVTSCIHEFFQDEPITECTVAGRELHENCCGDFQQCNRTHRLDIALQNMNHLRGDFRKGPASFAEVQAEIDGNKPVCVRIQWYEGGWHFIAIAGYDVSAAGVQQVLTEDPFFGSSRIPYDKLVSSYQGKGIWSHTFYVKPQ